MALTQALRRFDMLAAALLVTTVSFKPVTVYAFGTNNPPTDDGNKKKEGSAISLKAVIDGKASY